jgi:hypothetical protein
MSESYIKFLFNGYSRGNKTKMPCQFETWLVRWKIINHAGDSVVCFLLIK